MLVRTASAVCRTSWTDASKLGAMTSRTPEHSAMQLFANIPTNVLLCALSIYDGGHRELVASVA